MKIFIIGAGAMGCLLGAGIFEAGFDVALIEKHPRIAKTINEKGLLFEDAAGRRTVRIPLISETHGLHPADLIIVCVKAYDTENAVMEHRNLIGENTSVLTLQNGAGNVEAISAAVGAEKVVAGVTTEGSFLIEPGFVRHTGKGKTVIGEPSGELTPRIEQVRKILTEAGFETSVSKSVNELIWSKLVINAGINAVTTILNSRNGALAEIPEVATVAREAAIEAVKAAKAAGAELNEEALVEEVFAVARRTAKNRSSMLVDMVGGKRTEIDFIQGAIIRQSEAAGFDAPVSKILLRLVKAMEAIKKPSV